MSTIPTFSALQHRGELLASSYVQLCQCSVSNPAVNVLEGCVDLIAFHVSNLLTLVKCGCMYTAFTKQYTDSRCLPLYCICDSSITAGNTGHKPNLFRCCPLIEGKHVELDLMVQVFSATAPSPMVRALQLRLLRLLIRNPDGQQRHSLLAELQCLS